MALNLSIRTKVITCAVIGFAMVLLSAGGIYWADARTDSDLHDAIGARDALIARLSAAGPPDPALLERARAEIASVDARAIETGHAATRIIVTTSTIAMVVFALLALWIIFTVLTPVFAAMRVVRSVAAGDLTVRIDDIRGDETGQLLHALREMVASLSATLARVRASAESVRAASQLLVASNAELAAQTEEQAASLEQTTASMEGLSSSVSQHTDGTREASRIALDAARLASDGGKVVTEVVGKIQSMHASSSKIADIVALIDGIAFQTNILALNAAIEAARAGAQGRGFAVVAGEVRALAQRSAAAAREIKDVIDSSLGMIGDGSASASEAGRKMEEIVVAVRQVGELLDRTVRASGEQTDGIRQVAQTVQQLDRSTQGNAAIVSELAAAAEDLDRQAVDLVGAVGAFRIETTSAPRQTAALAESGPIPLLR